MFDVGQKLVCIDDNFPAATRLYLRELPVKDKVYTTRDIIPANDWKGEGTVAVLLVELRNPAPPHKKEWGECGFAANRFRELDTDTETEVAKNVESIGEYAHG